MEGEDEWSRLGEIGITRHRPAASCHTPPHRPSPSLLALLSSLLRVHVFYRLGSKGGTSISQDASLRLGFCISFLFVR